jgi:hypothetical protein
MFEHIKAAEEKLSANLDPRPHLIAALKEIEKHLAGLGHEATGETGAAVADLESRLGSLTSAVSSLGSTVGAIMPRIEALEAKASAPAAPAVPTPAAPTPAQQ